MLGYFLHTTRRPRLTAFSLLEMLIVITVIAAAIAMVSNLMIQPPRPAHASQMVAGATNALRSQAVAEGSRARVAICIEPNAGEKYLRQAVCLIDEDREADTDDWRIATIYKLPEGTMFWTEYSTLEKTMKLSTDGTRTVQDGETGDSYAFLEFDALGRCETGTQWVFTRGVFHFDNSEPPLIPQELDRDGFLLRKTGKLAFFSSPDQITQVPSNP